MLLGVCGSQSLSLDYRGRMSHLEFRCWSSIWISILYYGMMSRLHLGLGRYALHSGFVALFDCCFSWRIGILLMFLCSLFGGVRASIAWVVVFLRLSSNTLHE